MAMHLAEQLSGNPSGMDEEEHIEQLLSEKLMQGYLLLEKSCPVCATPLVKNGPAEDEENEEGNIKPLMVPSRSFDLPFRPVAGVPFCVSCRSHVITQECEISILERCDSLKAKGSILVALQDSASAYEGSRGGPEMHSVVEEMSSEEEASFPISTASRDEPSPIELLEESHPSSSKTSSENKLSVRDHLDEKKENDVDAFENQNADEIMAEYSVRREIATKVLGAKMLQGYTLKETQCGKCGMPQMEYMGRLDCVVCPALVKKAKKKMKAQQRLADETARLEREIEAAKAKQAEQERRAIQAEQAAAREKANREQEIFVREEVRRLEMEEHEARVMAVVDEEKQRIAFLEGEEARLLAEARARAEQECLIAEQERLVNAEKESADMHAMEQTRRENALKLEEEYMAAEEKRRQEDLTLMEETRRLEEFEERSRQATATTTDTMKRDLLAQEHRRRLAERAKLDEDISRLEQERTVEEMETRRVAEERRAEDEARMLAALEEEAAYKAQFAEEAIRKAKAALQFVTSARRDIIAQTIAMAEQEAVTEAESFIKATREDYKAPVVVQSPSDLNSEQWETLRTEGRSVMTRRVMAGWTLVAEFCHGAECENSPLVTKDHRKECVVCGGCGEGTDGAYVLPSSHSQDIEVVADDELANLRETGVHPDAIQESGFEMKRPSSPTLTHTVQELQDDFETKRNMVSKEIGKRMIEGWTLLDASCPHCVMPLMMDTKGNSEICVLCGLIENIQNKDGSTINKEQEPVVAASFQDEATFQSTLPSVTTKEAWKKHANVSAATDDSLTSQIAHDNSYDGVEAFLPSAPTMEEKKRPPMVGTGLADSIREQTGRRPPLPSPKGDPPASLKKVENRRGADPDDSSVKQKLKNKDAAERHLAGISEASSDEITISIPKNFDFSDEEAVKRFLEDAQRGNQMTEALANGTAVIRAAQDDEVSRLTGRHHLGASKDIPTTPRKDEDDALSPEAIARTFLLSPMGYEALQQGDGFCNMEEVVQLVDIFVASNMGEAVSDETKKAVAAEIMSKLKGPTAVPQDAPQEEATASAKPTIIHLEDYPSPEPVPPSAFNFEFVDNSEDIPAPPSIIRAPPRVKKQRPRVTPETMSVAGRSRKTSGSSINARSQPPAISRTPPRPNSARSAGTPRSRPPRASPSPRRRPTPRSTGVMIVGGPADRDFDADQGSVGDVSRADTVCSEAMDSILDRMEECKANLSNPNVDLATQLQTADLMEKLALAALAVKKLEEVGY